VFFLFPIPFTYLSLYVSFPAMDPNEIDTDNESPTDTPSPAMGPDNIELFRSEGPPNGRSFFDVHSSRERPTNAQSLRDMYRSREGLSLLHTIESIVEKIIVLPIWHVTLAAILLIRSITDNSSRLAVSIRAYGLPRNLYQSICFFAYDVLRAAVPCLANRYLTPPANSAVNTWEMHQFMRWLDLRVVVVLLLVLEMTGCHWATRLMYAALFWGMFSVVMKQSYEIEALKKDLADLEHGIEGVWDFVEELWENRG
jgi:hypothetical protein